MVSSPSVNIPGSVINNSTIKSDTLFGAGFIALDQGTFVGGITNNGSITAGGSNIGIIVIDTASISGGITNAGTITSPGLSGIQLAGSGDSIGGGSLSAFSGGITNSSSGSITANTYGIALGDTRGNVVSTFSGGISNSGTVSGGGGMFGGNAIRVTGGVIFNGGITNSGTLTASGSIGVPGDGRTGVALTVYGVSTFAGGINNSGTISSASSSGITLGNISSFSGDITNSGTISAANAGLVVGSFGTPTRAAAPIGTFTGNIVNTGIGLIQGNTGIAINNTTVFNGSIINDGTIQANGNLGVSVNGVTTLTGGITNNATIHAARTGIAASTISNFGGSIVNSAGASITSSSSTGIFVANVSNFGGGITNSGTISAAAAGIAVNNTTVFNGSIINGGTIHANGNIGVSVNAVTSFTGGITNNGTIQAARTGILAGNVSNFAGSIVNSTGANITSSNSTGIFVSNVSSFGGGVTNSGTISAATAGIGIGLNTETVSTVSTFSGGIANSGTILGTAFGLSVNNVSNFGGLISNSGTISSGDTGISLVNTPAVSIFDSGTITGSGGTAILFSTGTNTLTLGPGFAVTGNVIGFGNDVFQLGGTGTGNFNLSNLGVTGTQYTGFTTFNVISATWIATGTGNQNWTISPGATLQLGDGVNVGAINGNVTDNGVFAVNRPDTYTFGGTISGTGLFQQLGSGTTVLTAANSYQGGTTIAAGTLQVTNTSSVGTGTVTFNGGTFQAGAAGLNIANPFAFNANGTIDTQTNTLTLSGAIGGTGGLIKIGAGTLTVSGTNSYTGATAVNAGTFQAGATNAFAPSSGFTGATGAVLDLNNFDETIGSLAGTGSVTLGSGTLTTGNDNTSTTFGGTIGGPGGLTKTGSGTFTLTGTSNYSGATAVNAGALQAGATNVFAPSSGFTVATGAALDLNNFNETIGSLAGAGSVTLGSGTLTTGNDNASTTFGGTIAGTGGLTKTGGGIFTLAGTNSYTGATSINAGALQAGAANAFAPSSGFTVATGAVLDLNNFNETIGSLAGAGSVTLGSGTLTTGNDNTSTTYAGAISGTGGLTKIGSGTLTLPNANSYSGVTTLSGGTLAIGNSGAIGSGGLTIAGATLQAAAGGLNLANPITLSGTGMIDSQANSLTLSGTIGGLGGLTKIGSGTLTLPNANNYSGVTTLSGGTLAVGNSSALGTGTLTMAGGTTLQAAMDGLALANAITLGGAGTIDSQANTLTLSGNITGGGSLIKAGSGFLILSGTNSYTGGTSILSGTLVGTTASLQGNIFDSAALVFDQSNSGSYSGSLSGAGTLTIHGAGTVIFTGNSGAFTGETRLAAGALEVGTLTTPSASLGGTINVFSGGVLSGHGTVGTVNNFAGTVMPGGSIGTLSVAGNYTQNSAGTLAIEVSPSASSQLKVGGAATLGGTLALTYDPGTYKPTTYTFVSAPTINGSFDAVTTTGSPTGLSQGLSINPNTGQLLLGGGIVAPTNDTIFPAIDTALVQNAQEANSIVLDRLLARLGVTGETPALAAITGTPGAQFAQLGNSNLGAIQGVATALPEMVTERGGWFRGIGSFGSVNGDGTAPGFGIQSGGFLAGFDQEVAPGVFAGFAGGYTRSNVGEHSTSSGDVDTARIMGYGGGFLGSSLLSVTAGYAHDSISTARRFSGLGTAQESHDANELTLGAQWSLPLEVAETKIVPQAGARFFHLFENGFLENGGAGNNLTGQSNSVTSVRPFIGAIASRDFVTDSGIKLTPVAQIGYAREVANNDRTFDVNSLDGTAFQAQGVRPSRDILTAGAGLTVRARDNLYVFADYNAILPTGNTVNQTFSVGLRLTFPPITEAPDSSEAPLYLGPASQADRPQMLARQQELFEKTFRDPSNVDVILDYANVSARVGDNEAAAEALERLLLFNPKLPSVETELGVLYYRMGSFKAAQAYLDTARTLNPSSEELQRIDEYTAKIAAAQQINALSGTFEIGTQYQTDANVGPGSPLVHSPVGDLLLNNQFVKHDDTNFFAAASLLYNYDLGTQAGDSIELTGTGFGNHYLQFNRLDLDFGEVTAGPRFHFPELNIGGVQWATVKPYVILNEVGLGEKQYFWTYGAGLEGTALLWDDLSAKLVYEFRQKSFTNAPDRPLSTGLDGNDNLVQLVLSKPVTGNSFLVGEFDYLDQSTRFSYYTNNTYAATAAYHIAYRDPIKLLNRPWETVLFGGRSWSIYAAPDPCCNTSGSLTTFSGSARDDRRWRFGVTQTFQLTGNTALSLQLQRDIVSSNLSLYGYTSDSLLADLKVRF